ncbi:MAG: phosphoribosylanthranilate isomerase [Dysgonomonas sp.]
MRVKVCGMREPQNIKELGNLPIDFMGMIFYSKSPRFVADLSLNDLNSSISGAVERVGVFVNADMNYIMEKVNTYNLDVVQLHGNESPEFCRELNETLPIIKAFSVYDAIDFEQTKAYEGLWGYFLFDTKTPQHGGSGQKFDWKLLDNYKGNTPFYLSGGISIDDVDSIKNIRHPQFVGVDLNSRFEIEPGLKDIKLLEKFIKELRYE